MDKIPGEAPSILTGEEVLRILDAPDLHTNAGLRDRAILELLGGVGLKVRELVTLRLENIDLQISCVILPGRPDRMIPFGSRTRECLLRYLYEIVPRKRRQYAHPSGGMEDREEIC